MKRQRRSSAPSLRLDAIYNSGLPEVDAYITKAMIEEMDKAQQRAQIRVAQKFKHLLSPRMRAVLDAQYPETAMAVPA